MSDVAVAFLILLCGRGAAKTPDLAFAAAAIHLKNPPL